MLGYEHNNNNSNIVTYENSINKYLIKLDTLKYIKLIILWYSCTNAKFETIVNNSQQPPMNLSDTIRTGK